MKQYIKIDLYGQFDNDTKHAYTYPSKILNQYSFTEETVWTKSISDPRALHGNVCKTNTDCYVIWANEYGNYFSYITRNSRDSRGGMAMVTFFLERNHICDGRDIYSTLKRLSNRLIVNTDYDSIAVEEEIKDIIIYNSSKCIPISVNKKSDTSEPTYGYRTYSDENELIDIFTFIAQNTYVNASTNRIVKACGISKGSLFKYFTDKEDLYFFLLDTVMWEMLRDIESDVENLSTELFQRIIDYSALEISWYIKNPDKGRLIMSAVTEKDEEICSRIAERYGARGENIYYEMLKGIDGNDFRIGIDKIAKILKWVLEGFNKTFLEKVDVNKESFECLKKKYIQELSDYIEILKNGFVERKE
jgi:AcrR family transcriptional regulator